MNELHACKTLILNFNVFAISAASYFPLTIVASEIFLVTTLERFIAVLMCGTRKLFIDFLFFILCFIFICMKLVANKKK
jgi:hypothetical protein